ncbi:MAG: GNAT family N-acetyltransferase [Acidimicrobiales bacterium]
MPAGAGRPAHITDKALPGVGRGRPVPAPPVAGLPGNAVANLARVTTTSGEQRSTRDLGASQAGAGGPVLRPGAAGHLADAGGIGIWLTLAGAAHAEGTRAIYNRAVETTTSTFEMNPKSLSDQLEWIVEHSGAYPALVALDAAGTVVGFGSLSPYRPRPAYSTTVENSVYVHEDFRRLGIGRAILQGLLGLASAHGFHAVIARIAGSNEASQALHAACGFEMIGVEREVGRKFGRWLDVVCMERLLSSG